MFAAISSIQKTFCILGATVIVSRVGLAQRLAVELVPPAVIQQRLETGLVRNKDRQNAASKLFEKVGCAVQEQKFSKRANLICELPGEARQTIIVGAHSDFIDRGTGIVDDWSGTALLSSLYQNLHEQGRKHTFRFIAFSGEEGGLLGSSAYVKAMTPEERDRTQAFINLECLGVATPKVWVHRTNPTLLKYLAEVAAATHTDLAGVNVDSVGDDDTHPFFSQKIPVASIHSLTPQNFRLLHTPEDRISAINRDNYYAAYKLIAFYLLYLDEKLPVTSSTAPESYNP